LRDGRRSALVVCPPNAADDVALAKGVCGELTDATAGRAVPLRTLRTFQGERSAAAGSRCCCGGGPNVISGGLTLKISIHCTTPPPHLKRAKKARCRR